MAAIALVGEAFGEHEAHLGHPFVGPAGRELVAMLCESGVLPRPIRRPWEPTDVRDFWLSQTTVTLHNVFNFRPENNDVSTLCTSAAGDHIAGPPLATGKYVKTIYQSELDRLARELALAAPNVVVALGGTASWALLGAPGISAIRGAVAQSTLDAGGNQNSSSRRMGSELGAPTPLKVLPTYHPAAILRDWSLRHVTILDLIKAKRESRFPDIRRPHRTVYVEPTIADLSVFWDHHLSCAEHISIDIETQGNHITCIGFAPSAEVALVVPFRDMRRKGWSYWPTPREETQAWAWVRKVCTSPARKIFQNGMYDSHFLWKMAGIPTTVDEDTMLMHHALQPESPKGLGFLGACYTNESSWKLMNRSGAKYKKDE